MQDAVRRDRAAGRRGEYPGAAAGFISLSFQNLDGVLRQRQCAVGVLRLERGLHYLAVDSCYLPFHPEVAFLQIDVLPLQAQQFSPSQASCQLHIVHLEHAAVFCFSQERCQLFDGQRFHLSVLQFGQGTALCVICGNKPLLFGQSHRRGDDLVDVPHGLGAQSLGLTLAFNPLHPPLFQQLLVELL